MAGVTLVIPFAGVRFFIWNFRHKGLQAGLQQTHPFFHLIDEQSATMNWIFLFAALLVFAMLIAHGLYLSHRVAGPISRIEKYARDLSEGKDPGNLTFRKSDYFRELQEPMNSIPRRRRV